MTAKTEIIAFEVEHMKLFRKQNPAQEDYILGVSDEEAAALKTGGVAWTARRGEMILAMGGVHTQWAGRGVAWMLFADQSVGASMVPIVRACRFIVERLNYRRIEASVAVDFANGHVFAQWFGFRIEVPQARGYMPDGGDATLYVREGRELLCRV